MNSSDLFRKNALVDFGDDFFRSDRWLQDWPFAPAARRDLKTLETKAFSPMSEITENKSQYLCKMDLPGLRKEDIKIDIHDNRLTVSGERKEEKKEQDQNQRTVYSEVSYGSFLRTVTFPTSVNAEKVEAKFDNGVLHIAVAKETPSTTRQITIK